MSQPFRSEVRKKYSYMVAALLCAFPFLATDSVASVANKPTAHQSSPFEENDNGYLPYPSENSLETALQFVRFTGLTKNLSLLLLNDVKNEIPVKAAIERYGMDKVQVSVVRAIRIAQNTYAREWNLMLANVYKSHFGGSELQSILAKREASPFFVHLVDLQTVIASDVKTEGGVIFSHARADVMRQVLLDLPT